VPARGDQVGCLDRPGLPGLPGGEQDGGGGARRERRPGPVEPFGPDLGAARAAGLPQREQATVGVDERGGVDGAPERRLALERRGGPVDERPLGLGGGRHRDARDRHVVPQGRQVLVRRSEGRLIVARPGMGRNVGPYRRREEGCAECDGRREEPAPPSASAPVSHSRPPHSSSLPRPIAGPRGHGPSCRRRARSARARPLRGRS